MSNKRTTRGLDRGQHEKFAAQLNRTREELRPILRELQVAFPLNSRAVHLAYKLMNALDGVRNELDNEFFRGVAESEEQFSPYYGKQYRCGEDCKCQG